MKSRVHAKGRDRVGDGSDLVHREFYENKVGPEWKEYRDSCNKISRSMTKRPSLPSLIKSVTKIRLEV